MASFSASLDRHVAFQAAAAATCTESVARIKSSTVVRLGPTPLSLHRSRTLRVSCQAKPQARPETVEKVVKIVAKQLAAKDGTVFPHSPFSELGADSLDQVEIVMALEEEFNISVDENGAESIVTVQDAANLIENVLLQANC